MSPNAKCCSVAQLPSHRVSHWLTHFRTKQRASRNNKMDDPWMTLRHLTDVEMKAGEILTDRREVIALDKRRNDDRMGARALQKDTGSKTAWITVGPLLMKIPREKAEDLLERDQRECDIEINKIRSELKCKVNQLRDLELKQPMAGSTLKPLSRREMSAINEGFGL